MDLGMQLETSSSVVTCSQCTVYVRDLFLVNKPYKVMSCISVLVSLALRTCIFVLNVQLVSFKLSTIRTILVR